MPPVLRCFSDRDFKVQLAACDSMFNIVKICKEAILKDKNFPQVFDELVALIADPSNEVKDSARKLDDQLKDIVYASLIKNQLFDLGMLLDKICNKLSTSKNQDVRLTLIKWIETIHSITNVDILKCVPRFLEQFLVILGGKGKHEVYDKAVDQLSQFLEEFRESQTRTVELDKEIIDKLLKYLLERKALEVDRSRFFGINWLESFMTFFTEDYNVQILGSIVMAEGPGDF